MARTIYECIHCGTTISAGDDDEVADYGWVWTDDGWVCGDCNEGWKLLQ